MATGFTKTMPNDVLKRMIAEREAKGLHSRNVPIPAKIAKSRRATQDAKAKRAKPSTHERMEEGLKAIRRLGR